MEHKQLSEKVFSLQKLKKKYQISKYGFLFQDCLTELPEQFKDYQSLKEQLPQAHSSKFGQIADNLVYSPQKHSFKNCELNQREIKFMYAFLTLCYSRYVWQDGIKNPRKIIPQAIALPFLEICQIIDIKPSIAYASQITYNWGFLKSKNQINIQNLYCPMTMSGTRAQQWFYLIMVAIEIVGKDIVLDMYNAPYFKQQKLLVLLQNMQKCLIEMKRIIKRMYEQNPLQTYNQKVRQYLMGTKNIPGGVMVKDTDISICETGGSAAQSPLIQAITIFLRVQLQQTRKQFIQRNKCFMPKVHRQFLSDLQKMPSIKQKIENSKNLQLIQAFNLCIEALHQLRGAHFGVVDHYVFKHLKNQQAKGTGSSNAKHFLTLMMKETSFGKIILNKDLKIQQNIQKDKKQQNNKIGSKIQDRNKLLIKVSLIIIFILILLTVFFFSSNGTLYTNKVEMEQNEFDSEKNMEVL